MLSLIISVVGLTSLAIAVVCTALYVPNVKARRTAYRELLLSEGEAIQPAREKYRRLDRRQMRLALTCIVVYAVGLFSIIPLGHAQNRLQFISICGLTLCMWVLAWFATFGQKDFEIRMEVEEAQHRKRLDAMRAESSSQSKP